MEEDMDVEPHKILDVPKIVHENGYVSFGQNIFSETPDTLKFKQPTFVYGQPQNVSWPKYNTGNSPPRTFSEFIQR